MHLGMLQKQLGIFLHSVHIIPKSQSGLQHIRMTETLQQFYLLSFISYLMPLTHFRLCNIRLNQNWWVTNWKKM